MTAPTHARSAPLVRLASGGLLGVAAALVLGLPPLPAVLLVAATGGLTLAAGGAVRLVAALCVSLAATSLGVQLVSVLPGGVAVPAVVVALVWAALLTACAAYLHLRVPAPRATRTRLVPELLAAVAGLAWACWFVVRLAVPDPDASVLALLGGEDNAAWVDAVARILSGSPSALGPHVVDSYGPVLGTVLATVSTGVPSADAAAATVVRAYALLVLALLPVAALLATRATGRRAATRAVLAWGVAAFVAGSACLHLATSYGFLSAVLLVVVGLGAAGLLDRVPRAPTTPHAAAAALASLLALWSATASWLGSIPLGMAAVPLVALVLVRRLRQAGMPTGWWSATLVLALVTEAALVLQWTRVALDATAQGLLAAQGSVPPTPPVLLLAAVVLLALAVVVERRTRKGSLARTALSAAAYAALLADVSVVTTGSASYAVLKTAHLASVVVLVLSTVALATSPRLGPRPLVVPVAVAATAVGAAVAGWGVVTFDGGPFPRLSERPGWLALATPARAGTPVLCGLATDEPSQPEQYEATVCTRWLTSLNGADGDLAIRWRLWLLDEGPATDVVARPGAPTLVVRRDDEEVGATPWVELLARPGARLMQP